MRSVCKVLAMGALLGALACGGKEPAGGAAGAAAPAAETPQKLASTLRVVCWDDYITPTVAADFERELGVHLQIDFVNSNEEVMERLRKGEVWDVWTPSDYAVHMASERGLLAPLHHDRIPNLANVGRRFQNAIFDRDFQYSVPYYWGTTGWGYDKTAFPEPPATWKYVFDPKMRAAWRGKIGLLNDMREVIAVALISLGVDPNSTDPEHLAKARDLLLAAKADLNGFESESYEDKLAAGKVVLQQGWSGDLNQVLKADPNKGFVLPREGYLMFVDTFAIPKASPNQATAEILINYLLRPEVAAKLANESLNPITIPDANPFLDPDVLASPGFNVPEGVPFYVLKDLGERTAAMEAVWRQVQGSR
jgi:spermidine/putrescine transport system substrate-binding protein